MIWEQRGKLQSSYKGRASVVFQFRGRISIEPRWFNPYMCFLLVHARRLWFCKSKDHKNRSYPIWNWSETRKTLNVYITHNSLLIQLLSYSCKKKQISRHAYKSHIVFQLWKYSCFLILFATFVYLKNIWYRVLYSSSFSSFLSVPLLLLLFFVLFPHLLLRTSFSSSNFCPYLSVSYIHSVNREILFYWFWYINCLNFHSEMLNLLYIINDTFVQFCVVFFFAF